MFGIGPMELVLILVVALLVLGPKRMPELARTLGKGLSEFRRASADLRQSLAIDEIQNELRDGLSGAGSIHKPMKRPDAEDAPAQAGADLPPGDADDTGAKTHGEGKVEGEGDGGAPGDDEVDPRAERHPGELPDDLDPHAHRSEEEDASSGEGGRADDVPPGGGAATAADRGLGSVPVGGRTPEGGVPAGTRAEADPERERG